VKVTALSAPAARNTTRQPDVSKAIAAIPLPSIMPTVKPICRIASAMLRALSLAYSATVVLRHTTSVPRPTPVMVRKTNNCRIFCAIPLSNSIADRVASAPSMIGRRPNLSAIGPITNAPTTSPTAEALNIEPRMAGSSCQSFERTGALTASETTSNPSAILMRQHKATMRNWYKRMPAGASSTRS